jgi:excisionase family DNA binding protein
MTPESSGPGGDAANRRVLVHWWSKAEGDPPRLLTIAEVAARLRVCGATARRLCLRGFIAYCRVGNSIRVEPADVMDFVSRARSGR